MHAADSGFDQDDVFVLQYDLRSHAAPVHNAPSHAASIEHRQQVDATTVIGDLGMHVPTHAESTLLSDVQLGRALVHHQYILELPAGYFQHPDTADASQAVTVVAKATSKIKDFFYLLADIIGPATLLQDNLAELHLPIRSGNTPRTKHPYIIRNHLNAVFAHPQTLADIEMSKHAPTPHAPCSTPHSLANTCSATIKHRVQLAVTRQTINRIEQQA